uniref:Uncharacterized protein n=1 Tax=Avena sativa TaxID=4498 RepID=A0ACD5Y4A6_AVESA
MAKVHPNVAVPESPAGAVVEEQQQPTVLTVWRKSLLFNCDGFTVFDATGGLAFRVDRYGSYSGSRRRAEDVVLMDAAGKPLLTVRRKIKLSLSLGEHWVLYEGDAGAAGAKPLPLLSVRRHHVGLHRRASDKTLAHITPLGSSAQDAAYVVEGSYGRKGYTVLYSLNAGEHARSVCSLLTHCRSSRPRHAATAACYLLRGMLLAYASLKSLASSGLC